MPSFFSVEFGFTFFLHADKRLAVICFPHRILFLSLPIIYKSAIIHTKRKTIRRCS